MYTKQTQVTFSFPSEDGRVRKSKVAHLPPPTPAVGPEQKDAKEPLLMLIM